MPCPAALISSMLSKQDRGSRRQSSEQKRHPMLFGWFIFPMVSREQICLTSQAMQGRSSARWCTRRRRQIPSFAGPPCIKSAVHAGQKQQSLVHKAKETLQDWQPQLGDPAEDGEAFWLPGGSLLELTMQVLCCRLTLGIEDGSLFGCWPCTECCHPSCRAICIIYLRLGLGILRLVTLRHAELLWTRGRTACQLGWHMLHGL